MSPDSLHKNTSNFGPQTFANWAFCEVPLKAEDLRTMNDQDLESEDPLGLKVLV